MVRFHKPTFGMDPCKGPVRPKVDIRLACYPLCLDPRAASAGWQFAVCSLQFVQDTLRERRRTFSRNRTSQWQPAKPSRESLAGRLVTLFATECGVGINGRNDGVSFANQLLNLSFL